MLTSARRASAKALIALSLSLVIRPTAACKKEIRQATSAVTKGGVYTKALTAAFGHMWFSPVEISHASKLMQTSIFARLHLHMACCHIHTPQTLLMACGLVAFFILPNFSLPQGTMHSSFPGATLPPGVPLSHPHHAPDTSSECHTTTCLADSLLTTCHTASVM